MEEVGVRPDAIRIELNQAEMRGAADVGVERRFRAKLEGRSDPDGANTRREKIWGDEIEGAGGEVAGCKVFGLQWNPFQQSGCPWDSLEGVEFRTADFGGSLIIRQRDHDDHPYVLMVGMMPVYYVQGFLFPDEAREKVAPTNPTAQPRKPACFVPAYSLHSPALLREWLLNGKRP